MSSNRPKKVHYLGKGDKVTKCGRDPKAMDIPVSTIMAMVTCHHCITPNKPFTVSTMDR